MCVCECVSVSVSMCVCMCVYTCSFSLTGMPQDVKINAEAIGMPYKIVSSLRGLIPRLHPPAFCAHCAKTLSSGAWE